MKNTLNHIKDEALVEMQAFYLDWLEKYERIDPLFEAHYYLGFIAWQKQDLAMMQRHFSSAVDLALEIYRQRDEQGLVSDNPDKRIFPLLMIFSFASIDEYKALKFIAKRVFVDEESHHPINDFVEYLKNELGETNPGRAQDLGKRLIDVHEETASTKSASMFMDAVLAIFQGNTNALLLNVEALLEEHKRQCENGMLQHRFEGLICLWVTALARLASMHQVPCRVNSPWVPE